MTSEEFKILFDIYVDDQGLSAEMRDQMLEVIKRTDPYTTIEGAHELFKLLERLRQELGDESLEEEKPAPVVIIMPWGRLELAIPREELTPEVSEKITNGAWGMSRLIRNHLRQHGVDLQQLTGIVLKDEKPPTTVQPPSSQPQ